MEKTEKIRKETTEPLKPVLALAKTNGVNVFEYTKEFRGIA